MKIRWKPRRFRERHWLFAFGCAIGLIVLWLTISYRSIVALAAEWQFNTFGRYYPASTFFLYLLLFLVPLYLYVRLRRFARERRAGGPPREALGTARLVRAVLVAMALLCAGVTAVSLLFSLTLPGESLNPRVVRADAATGAIEEGGTTLIGVIDFTRTAAIDEDLALARRSTRFAPVIVPGRNPREVRFFVELAPGEQKTAPGVTEMRTGILRRGGLPGELVRLYRYVGYRFDDPYYVLFASVESIRWPYVAVAIETGVAALLLAVFAVLQHLFTRRMTRIEARRPVTILPALTDPPAG